MTRVMMLCAFLSAPTVLPAEDAVIPGYEGETKAVVDRALEQYRTLSSYQDEVRYSVEVDAEGDTSALSVPEEERYTLAFGRPDRVALRAPTYAIVCDGNELWQHIDQLEQYTVGKIPSPLDLDKLDIAQFQVYHSYKHPVVELLLSEKAGPEQLVPDLAVFGETVREPLDSRPGKRVRGGMKTMPLPGKSMNAPFELWFSDETGLLGEIRYDYTDPIRSRVGATRGGSGETKVNKYLVTYRLDPIRVNKEIPEDRFAFKPGEYDRKMEQFRRPDSATWQQTLVGRKAPEFSGKDLAGQAVSLTDLKGKVVLLDFWATWCGPCVMAMPQIQKVADHFKGKDVAVIGVNGDDSSAHKVLPRFLDTNKITYRQLLDGNSGVSQKFRVSGIPCAVLIDKQGVIQMIRSGFAPGEERALAEAINKLLNGESLVKAK